MAKPEYCPCVTCGKAIKQGARGRIQKYCDAVCRPAPKAKPKAEAPHPRECIGCGKAFTPLRNDPRAKRCKPWCGRRDARICVCAECGVSFHPSHNSGGIYCGHKCKFTAIARARAPEIARNALLKREAYLEEHQGEKCRVAYRPCICCEINTVGPRPARGWQDQFCGQCRSILGNSIQHRSLGFLKDKLWGRRCLGCKGIFTPAQEKSGYCCWKCWSKSPAGLACAARARKTPAHKARKRIYQRKRRALKHGNGPVERFDSVDVFKRDGWRCYVCGQDTPESLLGNVHNPSAPTEDHVVPLSAGGTHTLDNVRCACRDCNSRKSGLPIEEFVLLLYQ